MERDGPAVVSTASSSRPASAPRTPAGNGRAPPRASPSTARRSCARSFSCGSSRSFVSRMVGRLLAAFYRSVRARARRRAISWYARPVYRVIAAVMAATLLAGCAAHARQTVRFSSITPGAPLTIEATMVRPAGPGPFPAVVQLHGCAGLEAQSFRWARWLAERGYVALVVDSFGPRGVKGDCRSGRTIRRSPRASTMPSARCSTCSPGRTCARTGSPRSAGHKGASTPWR